MSTNKSSHNSTSTLLSGRNARQKELIPPDALQKCHAVVVGVGSIGRQVAQQLAAMGVPAMTLIDPDTVSEENLGCQGFWESDVGDFKVDAVANICHQQFPMLNLQTRRERFRKSSVREWPKGKVHAVFLCVDTVDARKLIWEGILRTAGFVADGRMAAEVIRVLASDHPSGDSQYPRTLFQVGEAFRGSCTAKSTIYAANIAAGMMLGQFARWLRGLPVVPDQTLNLLASELTVSEGS
ncbi:MAG: ThiF family adenylyltransferase [Gemmataceae bacterium]